MASQNLNPRWGHAESIANAKQLIEEIDANLSRTQGTQGVIVTDQQTQRILRVLRILTDQIEDLRRGDEGEGDDQVMGGGIDPAFDPNDRPWEG